jgi:hypothetical protein
MHRRSRAEMHETLDQLYEDLANAQRQSTILAALLVIAVRQWVAAARVSHKRAPAPE